MIRSQCASQVNWVIVCARACSATRRESGGVEQRPDPVGVTRGVVRGDQESRLAFGHDLGDARRRRRQHGGPGRLGLQDRQGEPLERRGEQEEVGGTEQDIRVIAMAEQPDPVAHAEPLDQHHEAGRVARVAVALDPGQPAVERDPRPIEDRDGTDRRLLPLVGRQVGQHQGQRHLARRPNRTPGLPLIPRGEAPGVHGVGDGLDPLALLERRRQGPANRLDQETRTGDDQMRRPPEGPAQVLRRFIDLDMRHAPQAGEQEAGKQQPVGMRRMNVDDPSIARSQR